MMTEIDTLLNGKVKIVQFKKGVKVSSDAVLLASVINEKLSKKIKSVLDVGVGAGGVSFCLLNRFPHLKITGIDIQDEMLLLAEKGIKENGFFSNITLIKENILKPSKILKNLEFDLVITNPPYYKGNKSPDFIKANAHSENFDLNEWIKMSVKRLKNSGTFAMIHKAERLDDILTALKTNGMGKIEIVFLYSKINELANRVLIKAKKAFKSPAVIYSPVILHNDDGSYSKLAKSILEDGKSVFDCL